MRAGSPWELGLAETQQTLVINGLRRSRAVQRTGSSRPDAMLRRCAARRRRIRILHAPLIVEGCVMMRKCHLNTCPVGHRYAGSELRARFSGQPEHVVNYFFFIAEEVRS